MDGQSFWSLFHSHTSTTMSSIAARPTKRTKLNNIPELPADVFRYIMSYVVDAKAFHKKKMQLVFEDITTLNLYNPIIGLHYTYDEWQYDTNEQLNQPLAVVNSALGGFIGDHDHEHYQFDVRFQTTKNIWRTMNLTHEMREDEDDFRLYGNHPLYDKHGLYVLHPATVQYEEAEYRFELDKLM